jgi:hypothetical protein
MLVLIALPSFASNVGQFVLTASLRSQVNPENQNEFRDVSPERFVTRNCPSHVITVMFL